MSFQLILPALHRDNPYAFPVAVRYAWKDFGRSQTISKTEDSRFVAGLKGTVGKWDWESAFLYNKSTSEVATARRLLFPAIQTAINDVSGGKTRLALTAQLFPRPHWNLNATWTRDRDRLSGFIVKTYLIQLHLYL